MRAYLPGLLRQMPVGAALSFALALTSWTSATGAVFELPADGPALIGTDERTRPAYEETLLDVARRHGIGAEEIVRANPGVDVWLPGGADLLLPNRRIIPGGPREGIVVNLPEHRLYYYPKVKAGEKPVVMTFPVGIGSTARQSPVGQTRIIAKEEHPSWRPTEAMRQEYAARGVLLPKVGPPGPDNPLGDFKMRLGFKEGVYEIHATNTPVAVGMPVTRGCILMYPEDLAILFPLVPIGTKVTIIDEPVKITFAGGELVMEVHPPLERGALARPAPEVDDLSQQIDRTLGSATVAINWDVASEALKTASGTATVIGLEVDDPAAKPTSLAAALPGPP